MRPGLSENTSIIKRRRQKLISKYSALYDLKNETKAPELKIQFMKIYSQYQVSKLLMMSSHCLPLSLTVSNGQCNQTGRPTKKLQLELLLSM